MVAFLPGRDCAELREGPVVRRKRISPGFSGQQRPGSTRRNATGTTRFERALKILKSHGPKIHEISKQQNP